MLKNYIKIALRNLWKQKGYTFINIVGLAVGLSCFILIGTYIVYELSFDTFHKKADRTYRVVVQQPTNFFLGTDRFAVTPAPLEKALISDFEEVEYSTSIGRNSMFMSVGNRSFYEKGLISSSTFFDVFDFPLTEGKAANVLSNSNSIVLTRALARKLFADQPAVGKTISRNDGTDFIVTGIIEEVPANSHFTFDYIASNTSDESYMRNVDEWRNSSWFTYLVLREGVNAEEFEAKIPDFISKYIQNNNVFYLQPLTDIHLRSHVNFELSANNNIKYIYLFAGISLLVLLLASVNYMNLAVAQSIKRTKEVGLRKVIGAHRSQLVTQFLSEAMITTLVALILAFILSDFSLPLFDGLVDRSLDLSSLKNPVFLSIIFASTILAGLISGSYPAFFVTRLQPREALKGGKGKSGSSLNLRNLLIVGQFAASIILVAGTIVIYQQLRFIQTTEMGYDRDHVLTVNVRDPEIRRQFETIRQELLKNPRVINVATSAELPNSIDSKTSITGWEGSDDPEKEQSIYVTRAGYDFTDLYDIDIVSGRNFSRDITSDTAQAAYLINESAAIALGWNTENAIGKTLSTWSGKGQVVGVMKDFHMHSLHMEIQPLVIGLEPDQVRNVSIKLQPTDLQSSVNFVTTTFEKFSKFPLSYSFLDDSFNEQYKTETRLGEVVGYFTLLAIMIAALGLFGIAAYSAEQRTKEIGIRKVLGASITNIVAMLSKDFVFLVSIGFVIAIPVAWYGMNVWLSDFAYRINIGPEIFVIAGFSALAIALLTVSGQALKAALANPVESLKNE